MTCHFGIDFGTTNTRIAFYDGEKPVVVPVKTSGGISHQIPSAVGYQEGKPVVFGWDALNSASAERCTCVTGLKWLTADNKPISVNGDLKQPEDVLYDFFQYLRQVVANAHLSQRALSRTSICVPVKYPHWARRALVRGMEKAGIEVVSVYHEPVAALYYHIVSTRAPGYAAVFDWGGGTLDIAVVSTADGWARVLEIDGLRLGGTDFDRKILDKALADFQLRCPELPGIADQLLTHPQRGPRLRLDAEQAKITLSRTSKATLAYPRLVGDKSLNYQIDQGQFKKWIAPDISQAVECLNRAVKQADVSADLLSYVLLSGGSSNIPSVRAKIQGLFGPERVTNTLPGRPGTPESDVANATAIGAARLAIVGAQPVFAREIGIRTADGAGRSDRFYPIFRRGEAVRFGHVENVSLFITDASTGVARVLLCDRLVAETDAGGRLISMITVPIDKNDRWVDLAFSMDNHLVLSIRASGRIARARGPGSECFLPNIAVGFEIRG